MPVIWPWVTVNRVPRPGWLKVGLWLLRVDDPKGPPVKITKIARGWVDLHDESGDIHCRVKLTHIQEFYFATAYFECDDCCRDTKSPTHCGPCLRRKCAFSISGNHHCELPHTCKRAFRAYPVSKLPMGPPKQGRSKVIPTRYERKWVI